jgi:hypothetical protein
MRLKRSSLFSTAVKVEFGVAYKVKGYQEGLLESTPPLMGRG